MGKLNLNGSLCEAGHLDIRHEDKKFKLISNSPRPYLKTNQPNPNPGHLKDSSDPQEVSFPPQAPCRLGQSGMAVSGGRTVQKGAPLAVMVFDCTLAPVPV